MTDAETIPVVILAFANDADDYLQNIRRERQNVFAALRNHNDRRAIAVYKEEETSTEAFFALFSRYADRVAILHYGGHASGTGLRLEALDGAAETAHAGGLARLLGAQKGLQLVFLNGCATGGQVELLLASGVRAVIATAVPINDKMATEFAEQFYGALGNRQSIGRAFEAARAYIATRYGSGKEVGTFRGAFNAARAPGVDAGATWGLYVNTGADAVLDWALPEPRDRIIIVRGTSAAAGGGAEVNTRLIASTLAALTPYSEEIQFNLRRPDPRIFPELIMNAYPVAIGVQLQKLFAKPASADKARLRQLLVTYEVIAKLFCYVMLSQLWDARIRHANLAINDDQWAILNGFLGLSADSQPHFDYFLLSTTIVDILNQNNIKPFVEEFAALTTELTDAPTAAARQFMGEMRNEFRLGNVPDDEVASFCDQAEGHLATLLADFAFVAKYPFSTIRKINFVKSRNKEPKFVFETARLDKPNSPFDTEDLIFQTSAESQSVILQIARENAVDYLNLTPFVIDESALNGAQSTRLFLYDYRDEAGNFHYVSVNNYDDRLVVNDQMFPVIKDQAGDFFEAVYGR